MLFISKPLSASQARTYHEPEFASEEQSYWSQDQRGHSEWQGNLAHQWDLAQFQQRYVTSQRECP
jgi:hypothetical protein